MEYRLTCDGVKMNQTQKADRKLAVILLFLLVAGLGIFALIKLFVDDPIMVIAYTGLYLMEYAPPAVYILTLIILVTAIYLLIKRSK